MDVLGEIDGESGMLEKSASCVIGSCPGASGCVEVAVGDGIVRSRDGFAGDV